MEENLNINSTNTKRIRYSGIDLLRIIAILLICFSHANQTLISLTDFPPYSFANMLSIAFTPFGTFGNILFVICSSFFLVDKTKTRAEKVINILMDSTLISITILIGFLISREPLTWKTIVQQIFPDIFKMNWFVPCYVIFYLLAPIIVAGLKQLTRKQHFVLTIISVFVYGGLSIVSLVPFGSYLLEFFYILNIVAFIKWHIPSIYAHKKINLFVFLFGMIITYLGYFGFLVISKQNDFFSIFNFINMYSPFLVIALVSLFNLFKEMKFQSKVISYLSGCSLFVYVIHENYLLRSITRIRYYDWAFTTFGEHLAVLYMFACGAFMFVVGFILAIFYKETLGRLTKICANKISIFLNTLFNKTYKIMFKENNQ